MLSLMCVNDHEAMSFNVNWSLMLLMKMYIIMALRGWQKYLRIRKLYQPIEPLFFELKQCTFNP